MMTDLDGSREPPGEWRFATLCRKLARSLALLSIGLAPVIAQPLGPLADIRLSRATLTPLSSSLLEITIITSSETNAPPLGNWRWLDARSNLHTPDPAHFEVIGNGRTSKVQSVGFRRRAVFAPLREPDLRVGHSIYLRVDPPLPAGSTITVRNPSRRIWTDASILTTKMDPLRWNPALHVNQVGYLPASAKKAFVGYYLGTLGEMPVPAEDGFRLISMENGQEVFQGPLRARRDQGYDFPCYQQVWEADFTDFQQPGRYRLHVAGLGTSQPFVIGNDVAGAFARTYALGLYHQRCGQENALPFTRFLHEACHASPASIPTRAFTSTQRVLAAMSSDFAADPQHIARQLSSVDASLYPFLNQARVDVSGGHHDAGDYSKYTINSAALIHALVFAADALPDAGELDNLGLPESGDGKSDLLQEAKWEADFLAKMQDKDGGFYFLVYPRDRAYEQDVLPDRGDPQVVFPKTTSATAAAVAALAQTASSPRFKSQFPDSSARYLEAARAGWNFLQRAIARHGRAGAYQKISHYGDTFQHEDELAWAAAEMYGATGEPAFQDDLVKNFNPANPKTFRWGWWRLYEGYGCAVRSYAFAARTGRLKRSQLRDSFLVDCEAAIIAAAEDQWRYSEASAYATSFPLEDKRFRNAAWYFPIDRALDLTVAYQIQPKPQYLDAIVGNINYELGSNPLNLSFLAGLGWQRPREIVDQYAQNDHRVLPPSGKPQGSIQAGFGYLNHYRERLGSLSYPPDSDRVQPYPVYDRWGDSFNLSTEFVVPNQGRALATLAWLMAGTPLKTQSWKSALGRIRIDPATHTDEAKVTAQFIVPGRELQPEESQIVWEGTDQAPAFGGSFTFTPINVGSNWIEAEAVWADGRRVFAVTNFHATKAASVIHSQPFKFEPAAGSDETLLLLHLDGTLTNSAGRSFAARKRGQAMFDSSNLDWMRQPSGQALRSRDLGDGITVEIPGEALSKSGPVRSIAVEFLIFVRNFTAYSRTNAMILSLFKGWDACLDLRQDRWANAPSVRGGTQTIADAASLEQALTRNRWHRLELALEEEGYRVTLNGRELRRQASRDLQKWDRRGNVTLDLGDFDGWVDEVVVRTRNR